MALKFSGFLAFLLGLALTIGHNFWAGLFGSTPEIVKAFASMTPLVAVSVIVEPLQGVVLGIKKLWFHFSCFVFHGVLASCMGNDLGLGFFLSGLAAGCGWQKLVCYVNLATYLVGMAISGLLGLTTELHVKVRERHLCCLYAKLVDWYFFEETGLMSSKEIK